MNEMMPFSFEQKPVRVVANEAGEPWFVAADVCRILELSNVTMALRILDPDEKTSLNSVEGVPGFNGAQAVSLISEPGMYKLMGRSRKLEARRFDRWVRHDVLPQIRKTGTYQAPVDPMSVLEDPAKMRHLLLTYSEKVIALQQDLDEARPVVEAYERIAAASDGTLCITDTAKALQMRPKDLFAWLAAHHWIYRRAGAMHWVGYQDKLKSCYLEHKVTEVTRGDGSTKITEQVLVTAKGIATLAKMMGGQSKRAASMGNILYWGNEKDVPIDAKNAPIVELLSDERPMH